MPGPTRTRNLTQIYIYRNSQFPLHVDLIQASLLGDLVINKVPPDSPYSIELIARALNSMHQKYSIPVRIENEESSRLGNLRYITFDDLKQTVEPMFSSSFRTLQKLSYFEKELTPREQHFWSVYQRYFDSKGVQSSSRFYKEAIFRSQGSYSIIVKIKDDYYEQVINGLYQFLNSQLSGGLNQEERWTLNSVLSEN